MKNPEVLYKPYLAGKGDKPVSVVFRDHTLSDLVGFVYSKWDYKNAVHDLIDRLHRVRQQPAEGTAPGLDHPGRRECLGVLPERRPGLFPVPLRTAQPRAGAPVRERRRIPEGEPGAGRRSSGSMQARGSMRISGSGSGTRRTTAPGTCCAQTRDALSEYASREGDPDKLEKAWEEIYIAEGSDWCWWYGDDHFSENDEEFDLLFRTHLMNVYRIIGLDVPDELSVSPSCARTGRRFRRWS